MKRSRNITNINCKGYKEVKLAAPANDSNHSQLDCILKSSFMKFFKLKIQNELSRENLLCLLLNPEKMNTLLGKYF